jgi:outer membrane receptor protein involved in Fe transport
MADGAVEVSPVQVTATRVETPTDQVPSYMTVVSGDDLRARGAYDLRSALALVAGVEAPAGGDAGPASAVPSFYGLHEFDAFLLVVDGVPWGGAFNPAISTLDLNDVERVEVLKGPAPVMYGATAFVGVIQVIHYPAGKAAQDVEVGYGTHGSTRGHISLALPSVGAWTQSLALEGERNQFDDKRERTGDLKALYRGQGPLLGGVLRLDADVGTRHDIPSSPVILDGNALTTLTPRDANYNPSDAKIDNTTWHGVLGYDHPTALGQWSTTASLAYTEITDIRGFLRPTLDNSGAENADSQNQRRRILDGYFDTHLTTRLAPGLDLVWGADLLYGVGLQRSVNGAYYAPLDGRGPLPATTSLHVDEINRARDHRAFTGQYAQLQWRPDDRWTITVAARLNETSERKSSTHWDGFDPTADTSDSRKRLETRGSGTVGATYKVWRSGPDETSLFADWRSAFKPAAIDFGPDNTPDILHSERAETWEAGAKGVLAAGRLSWETGLFLQNFHNLVIVEDDGSFANAGAQRMKGVEGEARWKLTGDLSLMASASWHDAKFTRYATATTDFSGTNLTLSPHWLASAGLVYAPASGPFGSLTANYVGERYLAMGDQAPTGAYTTADASLGWRFARWRVGVYGYNLSDVRAPVTASEFGQQSYYLLNPRSVFAMVGASF